MLEFLEQYSYLGLFLILFIEEAGIPLPIPGDIFIGISSGLPNSNYFLIVATVVTSTILGSTILFTLAKKIGQRLLVKYGKYIKITPQKIKKVKRWFRNYGAYAIIFGRLIPGFRTITPFVAGLFDMPYQKFYPATVVAAFIWANIYYVIGKFFAQVIEKAVLFFRQ